MNIFSTFTAPAVIFAVAALLWGLYSAYKIRNLSTIGRIEAAILYLFYCAFFVLAGYFLNLGIIWSAVPIIAAWIVNVFFSPRTRRYGCLNGSGYLRSVITGQKHGRLITTASDLDEIDVLVVDPVILDSAHTFQFEHRVLIQKATAKNISVMDVVQFLNAEYGFSESQVYATKIDLRGDYGFDKIKVIIEKILSVVLLLILFPVFVIVSLVILLVDGGPIFFRQARLGKGGIPFDIIKFRTLDPQSADELRASRLGRFLRHSHLDELPQIWNVLRGEMALLGPRPEWRILASGESAPNDYWMRTTVRPGITGWAQTIYKPSRTRKMRQRKLGHDVFYINHRSIFLDALIWLRTVQKFTLFLFPPYER